MWKGKKGPYWPVVLRFYVFFELSLIPFISCSFCLEYEDFFLMTIRRSSWIAGKTLAHALHIHADMAFYLREFSLNCLLQSQWNSSWQNKGLTQMTRSNQNMTYWSRRQESDGLNQLLRNQEIASLLTSWYLACIIV